MTTKYYKMELHSRGAPMPLVSNECSIEAIERQVLELPKSPFFMLVAALGQGVDHGNFLIWGNGQKAIVKLQEHRDFMAIHSENGEDESAVMFFDSDGSDFTEQMCNTIRHDAAIDALLYWLQSMERTPDLIWR